MWGLKRAREGGDVPGHHEGCHFILKMIFLKRGDRTKGRAWPGFIRNKHQASLPRFNRTARWHRGVLR